MLLLWIKNILIFNAVSQFHFFHPRHSDWFPMAYYAIIIKLLG